jgi:hypothetical protein
MQPWRHFVFCPALRRAARFTRCSRGAHAVLTGHVACRVAKDRLGRTVGTIRARSAVRALARVYVPGAPSCSYAQMTCIRRRAPTRQPHRRARRTCCTHSAVLARMWQGRARSWCRCGSVALYKGEQTANQRSADHLVGAQANTNKQTNKQTNKHRSSPMASF